MSPPLRRAAACALAGLLVAACAATSDPELASAWTAGEEVRPTLEEIFLDPPLQGTPPTITSVSADGRWCFVRWSDPSAEDEKSEDRRRLVSTAEEVGAGRRPPFWTLLPGAGEEPPKALRTAWSRSGHRLAVARGKEVFLFEPGTEPPRLFLAWGEGEPEEEDEEEEEDETDGEDAPEDEEGDEAEEAGPKTRKLGSVRSMVFTPGDTHLRISDGRELFELPLTGGDVTLDDATWWTRNVEARMSRLDWSDDLAVVFGDDPVPRKKADEGAQIWRVLEERATVLEGMAEIEDLEQTRLSPDGRFLFAVEVDNTNEPEQTIVPVYTTERVTTRKGRRRLADDLPAPQRLWLWNTDDGTRAELLAAPPPENGEPAEGAALEPRFRHRAVGWAPQPSPESPARLLIERFSLDYREVELWCWTEGELSLLYGERDERWLGGPARRARWTPDGERIVFGSEICAASSTPGRSQLFALDPETKTVLQLTAVAGEVNGFTPLAGGGVLFSASEEDLGQRGWGLVSAAAVRGGSSDAPRRYATPPGWSTSARAAGDGSRIVFLHESLLVPADLHAADFEGARRLTDTVPLDFKLIDWIRPERIAVESPDGALVHAHVYLPPGESLDEPGPPRATIVFVHGAGYLQNVTDSMTSYPLNAMFHSRLARLGYVVLDVDYRGSRGYGNRFRTDVQYHLGGRDLDDIHLVVDRMAEEGVVDRERVGVYGGSYGGFLTMMALFTAPDRWVVGAALRSVTDWRTYHPGYTVPRLGRPSTHPEAYERSSPIDLAEGLEDPLLILHGMVDSNVFAQDSIKLIEKLIDLGKDFDAMLYPSQGHAFEDGEHWLDEYKRIERYLLAHLGPPLEDDLYSYFGWASCLHGYHGFLGPFVGRGPSGPRDPLPELTPEVSGISPTTSSFRSFSTGSDGRGGAAQVRRRR